MEQCTGEFHIDIIKNGMIIKSFHDHNLVVDTGRLRVAELVAGKKPGMHITQIGVGSGSETEKASDTSLTDQIIFPLTGTTLEGRDARFDFLIDNGDANGTNIQEFGLFCADNVMFSHRVRSGKIEKESDIQIKGYWVLHF